jgi:NMD protein affecting ribosome stability and mRNA decay
MGNTNQEKLEEIKSHIQIKWNHLDIPIEWNDSVIECHEKLMKFDPNYSILQIKEKFGGLRYYFETKTKHRKEMQNIVDVYEKQFNKKDSERFF